MSDCPWCDSGFVGDIRTACERGFLLAPLVWRRHEDGCVLNLIVREKTAEGAETWLQNIEKYVQGYVVKEAWQAE